MILISTLVFITIISIAIVKFYYNDTYILRMRSGEEFDLKSSYDLTKGLSIITLYQGSKGYNFLVDTGSNYSHIKSNCGINYMPNNYKAETLGISGTTIESKGGNVKFYHNKTEYDFPVYIGTMDIALNNMKKDRGIILHGVLGSDFLTKYNKVLDYKNLIIHTMK